MILTKIQHAVRLNWFLTCVALLALSGKASAAARSVFVTFENHTDYALTRTGMGFTQDKYGEWVSQPPAAIAPHSTVSWKSQSSDLLRGVGGYAQYSSGAISAKVAWDNPFIGSNQYACIALVKGAEDRGSLRISNSGGKGNDCSTTYTLSAPPTLADNDYYLAFVSDTQLDWNELSGDGNGGYTPLPYNGYSQKNYGDAVSTGTTTNQNHIAAVNNMVSIYGGRMQGVIINGDLTAFGHDTEFAKFQSLWMNTCKTTLYLGLGNHDIANNVDDSSENNCATRMVKFLSSYVPGLWIKGFDFNESKTYYKFPQLRRDYSGSLAYSWNLGKVHFVQLNNFPTYLRSWNGWDFSDARRDFVSLTSSLDWLTADLAQAKKEGRSIILNFHDPLEHWSPTSNEWPKDKLSTQEANDRISQMAKDRQRFSNLVDDNKVSAIFVGHYHEKVGSADFGGYAWSISVTPTFYCGSALYQRMLLGHVHGTKMSIQVIDSSKGLATPVGDPREIDLK